VDKGLLESSVGELLRAQRLTLSVAESCTGGLLGHRLTNVPGSSGYFLGGVVAYSYDAKERLLNVQRSTLDEHGAVSEQAALEMARGVRHLFDSDVALSITGIAGPGGSMPGKPVGLVYVALVASEQEVCRRFVWDSDREGNKVRSAQAALELLLGYLTGHLDERSALTEGGPPTSKEGEGETGQLGRRKDKASMDEVWVGDEMADVEARYLPDGTVQPVTFTWHGRRWSVAGLGRQWDESDGRHVLVLAPDGSRFELCLTLAEGPWRLRRAWQRAYLA